MDFLNTISTCLSQQSLKNRSATEKVKGETPDISIFCFPWFSPIWYYTPNLDFPTSQMQPGFFLGIAENVGDSFLYIILKAKSYSDIPLHSQKVRIVVQSVVRIRTLLENESPFIELKNGKFVVSNCKGKPISDDPISDEDLESFVEVSEEEILKDSPTVQQPNTGELHINQNGQDLKHNLDPDNVVQEDASMHAINIPAESIICPSMPVTGTNGKNTGDEDPSSPNSTSPNIISQDSNDSCDDESIDNISIEAEGVHTSADVDDIADDINTAMDGDVEPP